MENIIRKLSEIETMAKQIMDDAEQQKQNMTENLQKEIEEYDQKTDHEVSGEISRIRKSLEDNKESQLHSLNEKTQKTMARLEEYYQKSHRELAQKIFQKITEV